MVIEALVERGAEVTRLDTGDFGQRWAVTGRIDSAGVWQGELSGPDVQVDLQRLTAVDYRRPSRYQVGAGRSQEDRRFVAEVDAPVVYKPMSPGALRGWGGPAAVYATLLDPAMVDEWLDAEALRVTANQFQRYIADKDADLRVTAVGQRLFPVALRAGTPAARVDWRRDYDSLDYELVEVPDDVAAGLRAYLKAASLAFAAFDLVRTTTGEYYFLEANANGEWGWLTDALDLPIATAIAKFAGA